MSDIGLGFSRKKKVFFKRGIAPSPLGLMAVGTAKDYEFADRQHNTLILIFGKVVLNKIYLIFQRLQIRRRKKLFFLGGTTLYPPPPLSATKEKKNNKRKNNCGLPYISQVII